MRILDATAKNGSIISYAGNPTVTKSETEGSTVRPLSE
jgi:hypothetical protein